MSFDRIRDTDGITIREDAAEILKRNHGVSDGDIANGIKAIQHITGMSSLMYTRLGPKPENEAAEIVLAFLGDEPKK